ncbi:chloroplast heterodimeric geranylgeranyl pyrophosphate synthase small subunit [Tripterygium wilfordii]|uniref:Chloroplast heterodimeric geranylgeranyl pyrophosphate synthase small subunit n=1 Tax=Tripterygium wilfordii TaxID=458696 RepID=A0A7J7C2R6_TRIWF|nr:geranylgeranyl pyrophosphate synthase, chloroplastic-like [Tripterygium wilfordii]KAF5728408.1 chloroplast heterodimeric geranylgeranyl pyrophosphate synthase small subunit [Tripterygium wilfordii]
MAIAPLSNINGSNPGLLHLLSKSNPSLPSISLTHKPMRFKVTAMSQSKSHWASINEDLVTHLKHSIPIRPPLVVFEPMHHLTFAAPETTAPALCIAACELVGGRREEAMAAASALHLIHAAYYAHEHLPLTDRARPKPKINHAFGPNIELLTGDGLVPFGFELLARSNDLTAQDNSDKILRVITEIARAAGPQGVIDGQYCNFLYTQSNWKDSSQVEMIKRVSEKKEGELHACAAACGAIVGGGSEEEIEKLRKYGLYVGMIKGMLYGIGRNYEKCLVKEEVDKLRTLALNELRDFNNGVELEAISSLVEAELCNA